MKSLIIRLIVFLSKRVFNYVEFTTDEKGNVEAIHLAECERDANISYRSIVSRLDAGNY